MKHRPLLAGGLALGLTALAMSAGAPAQAAASHSPIQGTGSSWSANAVNQWVADVQPSGLQVVFTGSGSQVGRKDFANKTTDFGVTDIGYQGTDKVTGASDTNQGRAFAYLPIVAGGTAFPYHLKVAGKLVRNLRLSGPTLTKIFTNKITNWNDPAITADNNGHALPSKTIIPVIHSEGSGSSAQFTRYMDSLYPSQWQPFQGSSGGTEYFPHPSGSNAVGQNGSDGVMNYVASDAADGAIGYDEYSYALGKNYPVAKLENASGYFTSPSQYAVAVALTKAKINTDKSSPNYLLQDLSQVYRATDSRVYAMSSYSYMIIPTASNDAKMTTAKRQTIADYLNYSICQGQKEMGPIGYSPLPINLAQASFDQVAKLKAADSGVDLQGRDISTCGNPTFVAGQPNRNYLAEIAPAPAACDKAGAGPCTDGRVVVANPDKNGKVAQATSSGPASGSGTTGATSGSTGASGGTGTTSASAGGSAAAAGGSAAGATSSAAGGSSDTSASGGGGTGDAESAAVPTELAASRRPVSSAFLGGLAVLLLVGAVVVPPVVATRRTAPGGRA